MPPEKTTPKKNPFFGIKDLQNMETTIKGINSTSSVPFPEGSLQLNEILDDGIWISIPPKSCSMGHTLKLQISGRKLSTKTKEYIEQDVHVLGVIVELEGLAAETQARLKFRQYSIEEWNNVLSFFMEKQMSINALIKRTRK